MTEYEESFDWIHEKVKSLRRRTNIPEWRDALDAVLKEFNNAIIKLGGFDCCIVCETKLNPEVALWAYRKNIKWYCGFHYQQLEATSSLIISHRQSFKSLTRAMLKLGLCK